MGGLKQIPSCGHTVIRYHCTRYNHLGFVDPWIKYEGWKFNSGNYLFTTDTK